MSTNWTISSRIRLKKHNDDMTKTSNHLAYYIILEPALAHIIQPYLRCPSGTTSNHSAEQSSTLKAQEQETAIYMWLEYCQIIIKRLGCDVASHLRDPTFSSLALIDRMGNCLLTALCMGRELIFIYIHVVPVSDSSNTFATLFFQKASCRRLHRRLPVNRSMAALDNVDRSLLPTKQSPSAKSQI